MYIYIGFVLLMQITEAGRLQQGGGTSNSSPKTVCWQNSFLFGEKSHFLLKPSSDWMRPAHIMEGNLLYSKSAELNVNLI